MCLLENLEIASVFHNLNSQFIYLQDPSPYLLLANKHYIRRITLGGEKYELVARGFDNVVSMDVDMIDNHVYLLDAGKLRIYRIGLDRLDTPIGEFQQVIRHNVFGIEGNRILHNFEYFHLFVYLP